MQRNGLRASGCVAVLAAAVFQAVFASGVRAQTGAAADRAVLEALYDATDGPNWTNSANWKTDAPLDTWHGVTTDAAGRVTGLDLWVNGLSGPIPDALGSLTNLERLFLWVNDLSGPIPDALGSLTNLRELSLGINGLVGPIPDALGSLTNLRKLDLARNNLSGPIPDALGSLTNLRELDLAQNNLRGPIPPALGRLSNLEGLRLGHAWGLSGPLPSSLRSAASLAKLDILVTRACAPSAWSDWLKTINFSGRLCGDGDEAAATIDVAVVHTPEAREAAGGAAEIDAIVDLMVAETNQVYETSGVRHRVALVGRAEVRHVEPGSRQSALALRERVGADLFHMILTAEQLPAAGGVAELSGPFGRTRLEGGGFVFAHELGHNMGLLHDRYTEHVVNSHSAYGYVNQPGLLPGAERSRRWRTIMSYNNQCEDTDGISCPPLLRFSNSRQRHGGDPLGVPYGAGGSGATGPADAAAVLDVTMPAVARWRDRPARANRPPTAADTGLPDRTLSLPGALTVDVSRTFADPDGDPLTWTVSSSAPDVVTVTAAGPRVTLTAVSIGSATIRVTATDPGGLSASQLFTATVADRPSAPFTDDPIRPGVTPVRAVHFTELRTRIDGLRQAAGLTPFGWTDPVLRAGATPVRLVHLLELRRALAAAYTASGRTPPRWTDAAPAAGTTPVRAVHLNELRAAVVALE